MQFTIRMNTLLSPSPVMQSSTENALFDIDGLGCVTYGWVTSHVQYDYIARIEFTAPFFVWKIEKWLGVCDNVID